MPPTSHRTSRLSAFSLWHWPFTFPHFVSKSARRHSNLWCRIQAHVSNFGALSNFYYYPKLFIFYFRLIGCNNWIGSGLFLYYVCHRPCDWQVVKLRFPTGKGTLLSVQNEQKKLYGIFPTYAPSFQEDIFLQDCLVEMCTDIYSTNTKFSCQFAHSFSRTRS